jgi:hypothetical protein
MDKEGDGEDDDEWPCVETVLLERWDWCKKFR